MERKKTIQELTSAIQSLRIKEADLQVQLEQALLNEYGYEERPTHEASAVKRQERPTPEVSDASRREERTHGFNRGDRVWIRNTVRKPSSWDNSIVWKEPRYATVTDIQTKNKGLVTQIHFRTDNGVVTWRAPNNLQLLEDKQG